MRCTSCVLVSTLADELNVRSAVIADLVAAGKLKAHDHGIATIAKSAADDLRWTIAQHRAEVAA